MPKRKSYPGRNGNQRRYYKARRTTTGRVRTYVPRTMGPFSVSESKYFDSTGNQLAIAESTSWAGTELDPTTLNTLVVPTEGSDIDNRVGRKIQLYKLSMRGMVFTGGISDYPDVQTSPSYRLILYLDKQTNGVQAQGEELMGGSGASRLAFTAFQNRANFGRFKVLKDLLLRPRIVTAVTDGTNTSSQCFSDINFKITIKFKKPLVMKFNATNGGTVGDIVDNSLHLIGISSASSYDSALTYNCRAYYKDN